MNGPDSIPKPQRIHLFGASGSGTTALGHALSKVLQIPHLDTDDYYWKRTDPPFIEKNDPIERIRMIERDVAGVDSWILSGSVCNWGDPLLQHFTLATFLYLDPSVRMGRLSERETKRYGARIQMGGDMYPHHLAFMAWAESYDSASAPIRSLDLHEQWMKRLDCPVIRLDSSKPVHVLVGELTDQLSPN